MKMNPKRATIIFLAFILCLPVVYTALNSVFGPTVTDQVSEFQFTAFISDSGSGVRYSLLNFTGTLCYGGAGIKDQEIHLVQTTDQTIQLEHWTIIDSTVTDASGTFHFTVNRTEIGTFYYKPRYDPT